MSTDASVPSITVAHRPVPGLMPAMTMPFRLRDSRALEGLAPGARVRFRFDGKTADRLTRVPVSESGMPAPAQVLRAGDTAPDFKLTDQLAREVQFSSLRGRVLVVNFLYTRCPVPEMCPRLAAAFASVHRRFPGPDAPVLLSITVDPAWDTPSVLASYARLWRARPDDWRFLTGTPDAIAAVGRAWGLVYWAEEGAVAHTARTYVIGRDGIVRAVVEGASWRTDQLASLVESELKR